MKLLALCLIPFLCAGHGHRHVPARSHVDCAKIVREFVGRKGTRDQDAYVATFPVKKQHAVLVCLSAEGDDHDF